MAFRLIKQAAKALGRLVVEKRAPKKLKKKKKKLKEVKLRDETGNEMKVKRSDAI